MTNNYFYIIQDIYFSWLKFFIFFFYFFFSWLFLGYGIIQVAQKMLLKKR